MSFSVQSFIEKSENKDKDIRFMALQDLHNELQKETFKLDESSQRQIAEVVLKLLDDSSTDVQGMAVKCLPPLVKKMSKVQIENSISKLSNNILKTEDDKRDIAKVALKTVIAKIPAELAQGPVKKSVDTLIEAVDGDKMEIQQDALESLADILIRFGTIVPQSHEKLQKSFIRELTQSKRPPVRKRVIVCLSILSVFTTDKLFNELVETIIKGIKESIKGGEALRTYLQAISAVSKSAGQRLGKFLDKIIPLLLQAAEEVSEEEGEDEVRENIMQAFESFITRCPEEVKKHVELIIILCKEYIEYDPNYSYEESDDEAEEQPEEEEEGDEEDEPEEDDDDVTWKVRTASVRCIDALIRTRPELLNLIYSDFCSQEDSILVTRFKERTESVKLDIFNMFINLLNHTITTTTTSTGAQVITQLPEISFLKDTKELIVKKLRKQLKVKSSKTRLGVFKVLRSLVTVLQGGLDDQFGSLVAPVITALNEKGDQYSALKLEVLCFLKLAFKYHNAAVFKKHYTQLSKAVFERINDRYYKVTAEALRATAEFIKVLASLKAEGNFNTLVGDTYKAIFDKLTVQDIDQDVKESAITATGILIANLGEFLKANLKQVLPVLLDRLRNEITRLTTCKALATIAENKVDISPILADSVEELALYLRKFSRPLRQSALVTLRIMTKSYGTTIAAPKYNTVLTELQKLVSDQDLFLAHLALELTAQIIESNPKMASEVNGQVLPKIFELIGSSTLQGAALDSALHVLQKLLPTSGFNALLNGLLDRVKSVQGVSKQIFTNIGRSVAALCAAATEKDTNATIAKFTKDLSAESEATKMLALFTIGEIGRKTDLSGNKQVQNDISAFFDAGSEELKNAASYALGNISVGNLQKFVPQILADIKGNSKRKYLLIHSLKEVISQAIGEKLKPFISDAVTLLFDNCDNEEEGIRNVVSECLGKLALVDYAAVMPKLKSLLGDSELKRSATISAVKYTITDQPRDSDAKLKSDIQDFLKLLNKNESVNVRRAAVLLLNSAAHNKPGLIRDTLNKHLPNLYNELIYDKSLVKIIKLGPFNHKVDQGLELRKSAFETLDTMLDTFKDRIDVGKFLQQIPVGLDDPNADIKMLSHLMTVKVVGLFADELQAFIDPYVNNLAETIKKKPKKLENAVQQEKERHDELLKSTFKALVAFSKVKGVEDNAVYAELINKTVANDNNLKALHKTVLEAEEQGGDVSMSEAN